jgi:hypothetical protein
MHQNIKILQKRYTTLLSLNVLIRESGPKRDDIFLGAQFQLTRVT